MIINLISFLLSSLLYIYYNTNLLNITSQYRVTSLEFIDDIVYEIQDKSNKENICKIMYILNDMEKWRKKYKTQFEIFKYILIYYIYNRKIKLNISIIINKIKIKLLKKIKYLEIIFNQEL